MVTRCKCRKCGYDGDIEWKEGVPCPICSAQSVFPVVEVASQHISTSKSPMEILKGNRQVVIAGVLVIIILATWAGIISRNRKARKRPAHQQVYKPSTQYGLQLYECNSCKFKFYEKKGSIDVACPQCKKETGQPLYKCMQCGTVFSSRTRGHVRCPSCEADTVDRYYR